jgi:DNA-binding transcriptional MerR regulator
MAYIHLLNLYKKIDLHLNEIKALLTDEKQTPEQKWFLEGRKDVLLEFREFLTLNLDEKLPRRIRKQLTKPDD